jgi:hypothetical protein
MASVDGGTEALTGFTIQSLAAILVAITRTDWISLLIDPPSTQEDFQKVDLMLTTSDGRREAIQVKSSRNNIDAGAAKKWAEELRRSVAVDSYRLALYAPTTGTAGKLQDHNGVTIEVDQGSLPTLWDALAHRLQRWLAGRLGLFHPEQVDEIARLIVGDTIACATERKEWTPETLTALIERLADQASHTRPRIPHGLEVSELWVLRGDEYGGSKELLKFTFKNLGRTAIEVPPWSFFWTDADAVQVDAVSDGLPGNPEFHEIIDKATGSLEVQVCPRVGRMNPGETCAVSVEVSRARALTRSNVDWIFADKILPTERPFNIDAFIIFPTAGSIEQTGAFRSDHRAVHWRRQTGSEHLHLHATLRPQSTQSSGSSLVEQARTLWPTLPRDER